MAEFDTSGIAEELRAAYAARRSDVVPLTARGTGFDLAAAYAVQAEHVRDRRARGRATVGRKVGYANRAMWRALKLDTLTWAPIYDDTVQFAGNNAALLSRAHLIAPKIEPEIVFKLRQPVRAEANDAVQVLGAVEWLALGFEIIDTVFADWKFHPADFVAAWGLHAALIVGEPRRIEPAMIPTLVDQLSSFTIELLRDGAVAAEGSGRNVLRSPALSLGELASAISRQAGAEPLAAGELVSTGTLTESQLVARGEVWVARLHGLELPDLTVHVG